MTTKFKLATVLFAAAAAAAPLAAQKPAADAGWIQLFDGKDLKGWRGYKKPDTSGTRWVVENGMLTVSTSGAGDTHGAKDIISDATFNQFDLRWEWKISQGGNSGVKYFVLEDRNDAIGHEYQIIDDERHADAKIGPHRQTAAFYDVFPAHDRPMKPAGEWNTSEVIVKGKHVTHVLNGKTVLEYDLDSPELKAAIEKSKFKGIERFGKPQDGHILLQDHGDQVWYRKIEIKKL
jgi:3-keto-disaccharide hydrolase